MNKLVTTQKIVVGCLGAPYGLRGWIKVNSYTQPIENIVTYQPWLITIKGKEQSILIASYKFHGENIIVQFDDCDDRDTATLYTNATISITRDQLPDLPKDEYYWTDLEGLTVINHDQTTLGVISYIMSTGANDVLVVKGDKEYLIPYLPDDVILNIDLKARLMHVRWEIDS